MEKQINEKEIHKMYLQIMCNLLNESKLHNFHLTDQQIEKIAAKRTLEKLDKLEDLNNGKTI